jgi:hypothetical protein
VLLFHLLDIVGIVTDFFWLCTTFVQDDEDSLIPNPLTLNSENIQDDGIYLLENGEDGFIYVGNAVNTTTLEQIFGLSSLAGVPNQVKSCTCYLYAIHSLRNY